MTEDDWPCGNCGKPVHLPHDPQCPHGLVACPECTHAAVCAQCSIIAEQEMYASGEYDPRKDPFIRNNVPPYSPQRVIYLKGNRWHYRDNDEPVEEQGA